MVEREVKTCVYFMGGNVCNLPAELNCRVFISVNVYFIIYIINSMWFSTR